MTLAIDTPAFFQWTQPVSAAVPIARADFENTAYVTLPSDVPNVAFAPYIPEPSTLALAAVGLLGLRRRRRA